MNPLYILRWVLFLYFLRVSPQHEQRNGADPYVSLEVLEASCVVIGSIEEIAVGPGQENII